VTVDCADSQLPKQKSKNRGYATGFLMDEPFDFRDCVQNRALLLLKYQDFFLALKGNDEKFWQKAL